MHFSPPLVIAIVTWAMTIVMCGMALAWGRGEERVAALGFLLGWAITVALRDRSWVGTQWGAFAVDVGYLVLMVGVALRTARYWPLWTAAFQLLAVMTHAARMIDPGVLALAYATAGVIWTQLVLITLAVGGWTGRRERRQLANADGLAPALAGATRR